MKKIRLGLMLILSVAMLLATTQVMASPAHSTDAIKTPATPAGPPSGNTPGPPSTPPGQSGQSHSGLNGKPENYKGTVAAVDASSITLTLGDGSPVTIGLNADTRIKVPGLKGATTANIQVGMTAMVQAIRDENENLIARSVMVIPGMPTKAHRVGWVTEYTPGASITIQAHDGVLYTFALTADTKILPAERAGELAIDSLVTIIAPRDPSGLGWTAFGIVVHPAGSGAGSAPPTPTP
ncbi:MAG TPA: DUF5666 domain-containing protein [Anaerolineales bacterium]|jgi:hypothetical protein